jgi:predicted nucleic acid-binding protein
MIILDTNVVSAMMQQEPDATVRAWLDLNVTRSVRRTSSPLRPCTRSSGGR